MHNLKATLSLSKNLSLSLRVSYKDAAGYKLCLDMNEEKHISWSNQLFEILGVNQGGTFISHFPLSFSSSSSPLKLSWVEEQQSKCQK